MQCNAGPSIWQQSNPCSALDQASWTSHQASTQLGKLHLDFLAHTARPVINAKAINKNEWKTYAERHFRCTIMPILNLQNLPVLEYLFPVFVKSPGVFSLSRQHYAQWQGC
jgi:hypothetical protein